jgi:DNA-binding NtrC family response regulator
MSNYRVLVVDDDHYSRLMLKKALEHQGYVVTLCSSGQEALQCLKNDQFDLIITDLIMEGISGIDLLKEVKKSGNDIATILLTGHASVETAIEAVRLGANDYMLKPINLEELQIRVKRAFEHIELEKKLYEAERKLTYHATIATTNHEINQPLTVVISAIDMIKIEMEKLGIRNEKIQNYLKLMQESSLRIANILKKLREVTHPKIQDVSLGMKMVEIEEDSLKNFTRPRNDKYVLVIEDEENLRKILTDVLSRESIKVVAAQNASEGLALYKKENTLIDLVILDFNLPDQNGLEVFEELKKINPKVRVVLTSGFDVDESVERALEAGAVNYIQKPFNRNQLLGMVRQCLSK